MTGAQLIEAERQRQIDVEGWTPAHDDGHSRGELAESARCYLAEVSLQVRGRAAGRAAWPWASSWWKPSPDPIRNLVKAGALIAAEIDRLQRAAGNKGGVA